MRVTTPAMKLDLRLDRLELARPADRLILKGVAGMLPCEASLAAPEVRALLTQALRPRVLWWLLRGR
ncbi:MAG: hypothetical protein ACRET2_16160 [Steroidobacteraceae bacterium]